MSEKLCSVCEKPNMLYYTSWDWMCRRCRQKQSWGHPSSVQGEWARHAKAELREFATEVLQPLRKDGTVNPAFVKAHGTKSIEKELKVPKRAILENIEKYG